MREMEERNVSAMAHDGELARSYQAVFDDVSTVIDAARESAARSVTAAMTAAYWLTGRRIVEFEQLGSERADYGAALIERLAEDLTGRFGRGFSRQNLQNRRLFYPSHQPNRILQSLSGILAPSDGHEIFQSPSGETVGHPLVLSFPAAATPTVVLVRRLLGDAPTPWTYAWSKSRLEIPRSLRIWCKVPVARSRFPCLGMMARRPLSGLIHISWDPSAWRLNLQPRLSSFLHSSR